MNCKQGDVAIIVRSPKGGNVGKSVTCLELLPAGSERVRLSWGPLWRVDRQLTYINEIGFEHKKSVCPDMCLMPIRPAEDEETVTECSLSESHEQ